MGMASVHGFSINVPRAELLAALKHNLARHRETYSSAVIAYKKQCRELLEARLVELSTNEGIDLKEILRFRIPVPVSYEKAYTQLIDMLEMSTDETVEVDGDQFGAWVNDDWHWKESFVANTSSYV